MGSMVKLDVGMHEAFLSVQGSARDFRHASQLQVNLPVGTVASSSSMLPCSELSHYSRNSFTGCLLDWHIS